MVSECVSSVGLTSNGASKTMDRLVSDGMSLMVMDLNQALMVKNGMVS